jgi:CRP-like cAMP-binding protein
VLYFAKKFCSVEKIFRLYASRFGQDYITMPVSFSEISRMSLFRGFDESFVRLLDVFFVENSYPADTVIVEQETLQEKFYIIIAGEVEVSHSTEGLKVILTSLTAGQFFGEISLFDPGLATAEVKSLTPVRTLEISTKQFRDFIRQKPELAADFTFQLAQAVAQRFRQSHDIIQEELIKPRAIRLGEELSNKKMQA